MELLEQTQGDQVSNEAQQAINVGIVGYTELSPQQIAAMNHVKGVGNYLGGLLNELAGFPGIDMRWLALARTHLQEGVMFANRAIARPEGF